VGLEGDVDFLWEGLKGPTEALMDAEVSPHIGAERFERSKTVRIIETDIGTGNGTHGSGRLALRSPNGEKAVISPAFLNRGDGLKKRCFPWFRKPMFMASARGKSMSGLNP